MSFFDPPLLILPRQLWCEYFGKPDGIIIRLRCWLLGHRFERCIDGCCMGQVTWCRRCQTSKLVAA